MGVMKKIVMGSFQLGLLVIFLMACKGEQKENTSTAAQEANQKPNIIYILADDMGYGDLGVYGQQKIQTPFIDELASKGIRFTQHYAGSTVCAPSRSSLMTSSNFKTPEWL